MRIGVPRETHPGERRVATTPEVAGQLQKLGYQVIVEKDAGAAASFSDEAYEEAGCTIADSAADIWSGSDIILKVRPPEGDQAKGLKDSQTLVSWSN
jgi:NAD(P) transhydrogenase subunit alpha